MRLDFSQFQEIEFPAYPNIVYVLCYIRAEDTEAIPFYVGESSRHIGRLGDYVSAKFSAVTDYKVGEAVKYLQEKNIRVVIRFRKSDARKKEEKYIHQLLSDALPSNLLNNIHFRHDGSDANSERIAIRKFIDRILENPPSPQQA